VSEQFLELELRLLIVRYGRQRVLRTLARLGEQTAEELEKQLQAAEHKRKPKRSKPSVMDILASECREHPEIAEPLRKLGVAFQNRTFLPQLRDVQRFLDRTSSTHGKLRSRESAAPIVFRALSKLTRDELLHLSDRNDSPSESDYSLLAREIMKTPTMERRRLVEPGDNPSGP
jgi:hypothetical protein